MSSHEDDVTEPAYAIEHTSPSQNSEQTKSPNTYKPTS